MPNRTLTFYDETGVNPLPAGLQCFMYPHGAALTPENLVGTDWTQVGGILTDIRTSLSTPYVAVFTGRQAPQNPVPFVTNFEGDSAIAVGNYVSPAHSVEGYASAQTALWPGGPGWFGPEAKIPEGNAYALAYGLAAIVEQLDSETQYEIEKIRLQSSILTDISTWAFDFLGPYFPQYDGEPNPAYRARIIALLRSPKCTLAAIQAIVIAYYQAIQYELLPNSVQNLALGVAGALGSRGALGELFTPGSSAPIIPTVLVWDHQSRPDLGEEYDIHEPKFVISIGDPPPKGTYLGLGTQGSLGTGQGALGQKGGYVLSDVAPDPRLDALVKFVKSEGTWPIYLVFDNPSSHTHT